MTLRDDVRHTLDARLDKLLQSIRQRPSFGDLAAKAWTIIKDYEFPPETTCIESGEKLLQPHWETEWHYERSIFWGAFGDINTDRLAAALHFVFVELIRIVKDSETAFLQQANIAKLEHALCDYLSRRGYDVMIREEGILVGSQGPFSSADFLPDKAWQIHKFLREFDGFVRCGELAVAWSAADVARIASRPGESLSYVDDHSELHGPGPLFLGPKRTIESSYAVVAAIHDLYLERIEELAGENLEPIVAGDNVTMPTEEILQRNSFYVLKNIRLSNLRNEHAELIDAILADVRADLGRVVAAKNRTGVTLAERGNTTLAGKGGRPRNTLLAKALDLLNENPQMTAAEAARRVNSGERDRTKHVDAARIRSAKARQGRTKPNAPKKRGKKMRE